MNGPSQSTRVGACCCRGLFRQHLPLWKSFLYNSMAFYCQYQIMYSEVRETVWTAAWFPRQRLSRWSSSGAVWRECPHKAWCNRIVLEEAESIIFQLPHKPCFLYSGRLKLPWWFQNTGWCHLCAQTQCSQYRYGSSILLCLLLEVCVPPLYQAHWFSWDILKNILRIQVQVREELIN